MPFVRQLLPTANPRSRRQERANFYTPPRTTLQPYCFPIYTRLCAATSSLPSLLCLEILKKMDDMVVVCLASLKNQTTEKKVALRLCTVTHLPLHQWFFFLHLSCCPGILWTSLLTAKSDICLRMQWLNLFTLKIVGVAILRFCLCQMYLYMWSTLGSYIYYQCLGYIPTSPASSSANQAIGYWHENWNIQWCDGHSSFFCIKNCIPRLFLLPVQHFFLCYGLERTISYHTAHQRLRLQISYEVFLPLLIANNTWAHSALFWGGRSRFPPPNCSGSCVKTLKLNRMRLSDRGL